VALDLMFLRMTRGNAGRNVKSATLAPRVLLCVALHVATTGKACYKRPQ
jgi:hypothetical protein